MKLHPTSLPQGALLAIAACMLGSCGGGDGGCDPTNPVCAAGVASIMVSSPVDSVLAVGSTVRLAAVATDGGGSPVSTSFTWSSSDLSVATVSGSGLVSALSAGQTTVTAGVGNASDEYQLRTVDAQLTEVAAILSDPFFTASSVVLTEGVGAQLAVAVAACEGALLAAHVLAVEACLDDADALAGADGTDVALLAVLDLVFNYARELLDLGR